MRLICALLLAATSACSLAYAQLDSNSVTVTASKSGATSLDQALYTVYIDTGLDRGITDVLALVQPIGLKAADLAGLEITTFRTAAWPAANGFRWSFTLAAPLARMKETTAQLTALQQTASKGGVGIVSFGLRNAQSSQSSQTCNVGDLASDARAKAQAIADSAGMGLGVVLGMTGAAPTVAIGATPSGSTGPTSCAITVKFGLSRY